MKIWNIVLVVIALLLLDFYIDMMITRREFIFRTELGEEITGCKYKINCMHYNYLLDDLKEEK